MQDNIFGVAMFFILAFWGFVGFGYVFNKIIDKKA